MVELIINANPLFLSSMAATLFLFSLLWFGWSAWTDKQNRDEVKKRLDLSRKAQRDRTDEEKGEGKTKAQPSRVTKHLAKKTKDFYSSSDPKTIRKMQMEMIQAGYLHPHAVGYFIATRFAAAAIGAMIGALVVFTFMVESETSTKLSTFMAFTMFGYFLPNIVLARRRKALESENRQGFPDVMDLMVVAAEAGLTTEASIERISHEIQTTYPTLSAQLNLVSLEIRAGRPLDQALRAFGERLGLDEIQGFATMIQQSKELGTSVSEALKVYSEEMRHKRMMQAEEKAYALPAKMSIPVTVFILPIVIGVAVTPTAVRLMTGAF